MGARNTTPRTIHLDNDAPSGVIDVSDDVVHRLKGLHSKSRAEQNEHDRQVAEAAVAAAKLEWQKQLQQQPSPQPPPQQIVSQPNRNQSSPIIYHGDSTVTALEVRRQKEEELRNNDIYWERRLKQQEQDLQRTNVILEKEYNETFNEVRKRFENAPLHHQVSACKELKAKLVDCYQVNSKQPLNCSDIVVDFTNCVQNHRTKLLNEKYKPTKQTVAVAAAS